MLLGQNCRYMSAPIARAPKTKGKTYLTLSLHIISITSCVPPAPPTWPLNPHPEYLPQYQKSYSTYQHGPDQRTLIMGCNDLNSGRMSMAVHTVERTA